MISNATLTFLISFMVGAAFCLFLAPLFQICWLCLLFSLLHFQNIMYSPYKCRFFRNQGIKSIFHSIDTSIGIISPNLVLYVGLYLPPHFLITKASFWMIQPYLGWSTKESYITYLLPISSTQANNFASSSLLTDIAGVYPSVYPTLYVAFPIGIPFESVSLLVIDENSGPSTCMSR